MILEIIMRRVVRFLSRKRLGKRSLLVETVWLGKAIMRIEGKKRAITSDT